MAAHRPQIFAGAALLAVAGFLAIGGVAAGILLREDRSVTFVAPGESSLNVTEPGEYGLWHDHTTHFDGRSFDRSPTLPDGWEIEVRSDRFGELPLDPTTMRVTMQVGSTHRQKIGTVTVPAAPARLEISASGPGETVVLSFGDFGFLKTMAWIFGGIGLGAVCALVAFALLLRGFFGRRRTRPRKRMPGQPPPHFNAP